LKGAGDVGRIDDLELDGLAIPGDRATRHVELRQVDRHTGLRPNEYRAERRNSTTAAVDPRIASS